MLFNAFSTRKPHQRSIHSLGSGSTLLWFRSWSWSWSQCNLTLGLGGLVCCYGPVSCIPAHGDQHSCQCH